MEGHGAGNPIISSKSTWWSKCMLPNQATQLQREPWETSKRVGHVRIAWRARSMLMSVPVGLKMVCEGRSRKLMSEEGFRDLNFKMSFACTDLCSASTDEAH